MAARIKIDRRALDKVGRHPEIQKQTLKVARDVQREVRRRVGNRTQPFADQSIAKNTPEGAAVGTDWGPAVPTEFGTFDTPAQRILTGAAERVAGRVTPR